MDALVVILIAVVGLFQIPFLIDVLNTLLPVKLQRQVGLVFTTLLRLGVLFIVWATYYLYCTVWLWFFVEPFSPLSLVLLSIPATWTWYGSTYHFLFASFSEPGVVPVFQSSVAINSTINSTTESTSESTSELATLNLQSEMTPSMALSCLLKSDPSDAAAVMGTCAPCGGVPKPPGARHCSVCGRCVYFMDHHCPFTGSCLGVQNYAHFFLFLCFAFLGLLEGSLLSLYSFLWCLPSNLDLHSDANLGLDLNLDFNAHLLPASCELLGAQAYVFVPLGVVCLCVGVLLAVEFYVLVRNRTTLHFCASCRSHSHSSDLRYPPVFGAPSKYRFLLTRGRPFYHLLHPLFKHSLLASEKPD